MTAENNENTHREREYREYRTERRTVGRTDGLEYRAAVHGRARDRAAEGVESREDREGVVSFAGGGLRLKLNLDKSPSRTRYLREVKEEGRKGRPTRWEKRQKDARGKRQRRQGKDMTAGGLKPGQEGE